ncbi:hypothetical protein SYNPS1DRAFT_31830 [Syncephalis pseudoplumigaleata]|uniref:Uncharacterized protein n=1 Tax=Syncephalis pseudoplumigaleata TaxID=1712513 RepID=A0A4P9YTR7_9FUNG|nr:hypothetical protein SYNPS1DRAFT_31830 [Syncephalis pseudoplumigaleata]|eukprot:RKP22561.1 hypothetical protein SYNPS1DRAFT_31830 [Syncephalis pseudoplumigaleata]
MDDGLWRIVAYIEWAVHRACGIPGGGDAHLQLLASAHQLPRADAAEIIEQLHRLLDEPSLQIRPYSTTAAQTCLEFELVPPSSPVSDGRQPMSADGKLRWCLSSRSTTAATATVATTVASMSQSDAAPDACSWPTVDEMVELVEYGLIASMYYLGTIALFFIAIPCTVCMRLYRYIASLLRRNHAPSTPAGPPSRAATGSGAASRAQQAPLAPPHITTYRAMRMGRHYGSTNDTHHPALRANNSSMGGGGGDDDDDDDDNMPLASIGVGTGLRVSPA